MDNKQLSSSFKKFINNLNKPIVFFDLETTGFNKDSDNIIQFSALKFLPQTISPETRDIFINPNKPINNSNIHGITNEMVKDSPTFEIASNEIFEFINECDMGGYNIFKFDIPFLYRQLMKENKTWNLENISIIDPLIIFQKEENSLIKKKLIDASEFYLNKKHEHAHNALEDIKMTARVFMAQFFKYGHLDKNMKELAEHYQISLNFDKFNLDNIKTNSIDIDGKIFRDKNGVLAFNFGKHKNKPILENQSYAKWMLKENFSTNTKDILKKILNKELV